MNPKKIKIKMEGRVMGSKNFSLIFRTPSKWGKEQIPVVIFFSPFSLCGTILVVYNLIYRNLSISYIAIVIVALIAFYSIKFLTSTVFSWFTGTFLIEIKGDQLICYNLFNKETVYNINDFVKAGKDKRILCWGYYTYAFIDNKGRILYLTNTDFEGFVNDYIILNAKNIKSIDEKWLKKLRSKPDVWRYKRTRPHTTEYLDGYLEWLEPIVEKQKQDMISRGILDPDLYNRKNKRGKKGEQNGKTE